MEVGTSGGRRWVIFDGDNTLWQTEQLYDEARERFCRVLIAQGHDSAAVRGALIRSDARWYPVFGYSANRFFRSLEDTFCEVAGFPDQPESVRRFQALKAEVHAILHGKARLAPAVELVLRSLHMAGYQLALMSAGDDWLQQKRIREFHLGGMFRLIEIVPERNVAALCALCGRAGIDPTCSWLIGDGLRADILPAVAAGLGAIWVPAPRWEPDMDEGQTLVPSADPAGLAALLERFDLTDVRRLRAVDALGDILPILGVRPIDLRLPPAPPPAVYAIFEGGGTKGIAHVGAYKACEERGLRVLGVAGTSAGAILAGFLAAGFTADELFTLSGPDEATALPDPAGAPAAEPDSRETGGPEAGGPESDALVSDALESDALGFAVAGSNVAERDPRDPDFRDPAFDEPGCSAGPDPEGPDAFGPDAFAPGAAYPARTVVRARGPGPDAPEGPRTGLGDAPPGGANPGGPYNESYLDIMGRRHWLAAKSLLSEAAVHVQALLAPNRAGAVRRGLDCARQVQHWLAIGRLLARHWPRLAEAARALGYFQTDTFVAWYNSHLCRKVKPSHVDGMVRFRDIRFPLKIISTDLSHRMLCVHPDDSGPDTVVAEAVAASMAIPLVFRPRRLRRADGTETLHLDGGILSNYPAWLFARGAGNHGPTVPVLGFELEDAVHVPTTEFDPLHFVAEIITTAINGAKSLEIRDLDHLYRITLPVSTGAYAFNPTPADKDRGYREGYDAAAAFFARTLQLVTQEQLAPELQAVHWAMLRELGDDQVHLRVHVAARTPLGRLKLRFCYNMDFDPDDHLEFDDFTIGPQGHCWTGRIPVVVDLQEARRAPAEHGLRKYDLALMRPSLRSLLCVPVFDPRAPAPGTRRQRTPPLAVLGFDSDEDLLTRFREPRIQSLAREMATAVAARWVELATGGGKW